MESAAVGGPAADSSAAEDRLRGRSGFALVISDGYLLLIAALMLLSNLVNTTGEYILGKTVVTLYTAAHGAASAGGLNEKKVIGEFYGNFFTVVNVLSGAVQALLVSRVLKYFGVRIALLVLPVVALLGYGSMAFFPILSFIRTAKLAENSLVIWPALHLIFAIKVAENSLDYSLQSTSRNALWLLTSREAKYKAKQANDTFFVRFGDVISAGIVFAGTTWFAFAPKHFAVVNIVLIGVWLAVAIALGRRFNRLAGTS